MKQRDVNVLDELCFLNTLSSEKVRVSFPHAGRVLLHDLTRNIKTCYHSMYFVEQGVLHGETRGESFTLKKGGVLWIQPIHAYRMIKREKEKPCRIIYLKFTVEGEELSCLNDNYMVPEASSLRLDFVDLLDHYVKDGPWTPYQVRFKMSLLMANILELQHEKAGARGVMSNALRKEIEHYVRTQLHLTPSLSDFAKVKGLQPDTLARHFKKAFGLNFKQYLNREKIRKATGMLLESDMNVSEVSRALGYQHTRYFVTQFKAYMGQPPHRWRKESLV